jgi:hypothetical protein
MSGAGVRITDVDRGDGFTVLVDGQAIPAYEGETVAVVLLAAGQRRLRTTGGGQPRGLYCGMGICQDCLVTIDGMPSHRACVTPARPGMRILTQHGLGAWAPPR